MSSVIYMFNSVGSIYTSIHGKRQGKCLWVFISLKVQVLFIPGSIARGRVNIFSYLYLSQCGFYLYLGP